MPSMATKMILETFREHFSISILNHLENWELRRFHCFHNFASINSSLSTLTSVRREKHPVQPSSRNWSVTPNAYFPVEYFRYRTLKRYIIAICTSLPRQLLRPKNAWGQKTRGISTPASLLDTSLLCLVTPKLANFGSLSNFTQTSVSYGYQV